MALARATTPDGAILYEPTRIRSPGAQDFDALALWRAGRTTPTPAGRGSSWFVTPADGATGRWVLRHYRRGGMVAALLPAALHDRYLWTGEASTRCFLELALLAELECRALPAPRPVAARYARRGPTYQADLLTVEIEGARSLASLLGELGDEDWRRVGECVRRFHDAGLWHADLTAHNLLFDATRTVHLIDFDRARLGRGPAPARGNLARLARSLAKVARAAPAARDDAGWARLRAGYDRPRSSPPR